MLCNTTVSRRKKGVIASTEEHAAIAKSDRYAMCQGLKLPGGRDMKNLDRKRKCAMTAQHVVLGKTIPCVAWKRLHGWN